ncbi:MAG: 50S ribosomal protein L24 [Candidatus Hydrogenedentes bacterium]|nr:50S ribosomal protein L24 [Candidatus Hydrogenedentota bacterium]
MYIRKKDTVLITRGRYKGRVGRVLDVYPKKDKLLVEGVNVHKHHTKPGQKTQSGGIISREAPIHISNVMAWCESEKKPSKILMKQLSDGSRVRVWKITGETLD